MTLAAFLLMAPVLILTLAFSIEVMMGLTPLQYGTRCSSDGNIVVVVPANDEALVIGETVQRLRSQSDAHTRILVVADNCTDDTALRAHDAGAEVITREDRVLRGKGHALAFARDHLLATPPQCVVVIDADCMIDRASLDELAGMAMATGRPVQAASLLRPDLQADAIVQVSNFAFVVKNLVRQRGLYRLSGRAHLTGTGMAFPWALFASAPLATGSVVEDLALGLDMSSAGFHPIPLQDAIVWSAASNVSGTLKQRTRWEGGFIATSLRQAVPIMARALRAADAGAFWSGLSLAIPPLTLLVLLNLIVSAGLGIAVWFGASPLLLGVQLLNAVSSAAVLVVAWRRFGRPFLTPAAARILPLYLLWKLPLYAGLLKGDTPSWLRTGR